MLKILKWTSHSAKQGEGDIDFQTFAENPLLYPGMIVKAIVYVRRRWCVC